jgi:hypothetical protein
MIATSRIKFSCPTCHTTLKVPSRKRGAITNCPRCNQRLQVPVSSNDDDKDTDIEEAGGGIAHGLSYVVRLMAWTACLFWVAYLLWSKCNPHDFLGGVVPETAQSTAVGVQALAAYIAARAIDSVSRR